MSCTEVSVALAVVCGACAHGDRTLPPFAKKLYDTCCAAAKNGGDSSATAAAASAFELGALCAVAARGENRPGVVAQWAIDLLTNYAQRATERLPIVPSVPQPNSPPTTQSVADSCDRGIVVNSNAPQSSTPISAPALVSAPAPAPAPETLPSSAQLDEEARNVIRAKTLRDAARRLAEMQGN
jgi:hypothetical protein